MTLSDATIRNLAVLASHCLSGKTVSDTPEMMSSLWADIAAVNKYLKDKEEVKAPAEAKAP